eukprot:1828154-Rhodomonas_salina.1
MDSAGVREHRWGSGVPFSPRIWLQEESFRIFRLKGNILCDRSQTTADAYETWDVRSSGENACAAFKRQGHLISECGDRTCCQGEPVLERVTFAATILDLSHVRPTVCVPLVHPRVRCLDHPAGEQTQFVRGRELPSLRLRSSYLLLYLVLGGPRVPEHAFAPLE